MQKDIFVKLYENNLLSLNIYPISTTTTTITIITTTIHLQIIE